MTTKAWVFGAASLALGSGLLTACEHVQEPWITNAAEWKQEKFHTQTDDAELRHRLAHGQQDR